MLRPNKRTEVIDLMVEWIFLMVRSERFMAASTKPRARGIKTTTRPVIGKAIIIFERLSLRLLSEIMLDNSTKRIIITTAAAISIVPITILPKSYVRHHRH